MSHWRTCGTDSRSMGPLYPPQLQPYFKLSSLFVPDSQPRRPNTLVYPIQEFSGKKEPVFRPQSLRPQRLEMRRHAYPRPLTLLSRPATASLLLCPAFVADCPLVRLRTPLVVDDELVSRFRYTALSAGLRLHASSIRLFPGLSRGSSWSLALVSSRQAAPLTPWIERLGGSLAPEPFRGFRLSSLLPVDGDDCPHRRPWPKPPHRGAVYPLRPCCAVAPRLVPSWVVPNLFYCLTTSLNSDPAYLAILLSNLLGVSYDLYLSTSVCDFTQTR